MKLLKTEIGGVFIVENFHAQDNRGSFTKTYHEGFFMENNLCADFEESYFSLSQTDVIRGMHFQLPPFDHAKMVYVVKGEATDVILDLRKTSKTYGDFIVIALSDINHRSVYMPKGVAHGFKAKRDGTIMVYNVSTSYNKEHDAGIRFDSFGYDWEIADPIISSRDRSLVTFDEFKVTNPF